MFMDDNEYNIENVLVWNSNSTTKNLYGLGWMLSLKFKFVCVKF